MSIGQRIEAWLKQTAFGAWIVKYRAEYADRRTKRQESLSKLLARYKESGDVRLLGVYLWTWVQIIFAGGDIWLPADIDAFGKGAVSDLDEFTANPQAYLQRKLREFATSPETIAFSQVVGTIVTEPVVSLLETFAGQENPDPHEFARAFHGIASGLPWGAKMLDASLQAVLGDRAPALGKYIDNLYWGLGLGFLGWQTLAPLLSSGLQPPLERNYNRLYRPKRFSPNELRDLLALGKISADQLREGLREQGWRENDIQPWIDLAYRSLSEGVIWQLYNKGAVTQQWAVARLREAGYNPNDISYLFLVNEKEDTEEALRYSLSTAKAAFKNQIIGEDEFRQILTTLKFQPREIDLQIAVIRAGQQQETKELSTGQIKALYNNKIIGSGEAIHNLIQLDYTEAVAQQLVKLWDEQALPKAARINRSSIVAAYREGVIDRNQAKSMLQSESGFSGDTAELLLKIEDAEAARRGAQVQASARALSLAQLEEFVKQGLLTRDELGQRAEFDRYSAEDKARLIELMFAQPIVEPKQLSEGALIEAYIAGVITRDDLTARLVARGLSAEDTETLLRTVELENPDVFGEFTSRYIGQPTIGAIQLALQRGLIDEQGFRDRLAQMGFGLDAIEIFLFNAQYQAPDEPKKFTDATILRLYNDDWLTRQQSLERLLQNNYTVDDANLLLDAELKGLLGTELAGLFEAGIIDQATFEAMATNQGWEWGDIELYYAQIGYTRI